MAKILYKDIEFDTDDGYIEGDNAIIEPPFYPELGCYAQCFDLVIPINELGKHGLRLEDFS